MLEGTHNQASGTNLIRAHWGWYSSGSVDQGAQYDDEIQIWSLPSPLTDFENEPGRRQVAARDLPFRFDANPAKVAG